MTTYIKGMNEQRLLVLSSLILLFFSFIVVHTHHPIEHFTINTENQFTYGNPDAPIHMIILEEFACPQCQLFHQKELPTIEKEFVETGKMRVTIIPLAFLDASLPACNLILALHTLYPDALKPFYEFLFKLPQETLLSQSSRTLLSLFDNPELPQAKILQYLRTTNLDPQIDHNLSLAEQIYKGSIHVPIILINGKLIPNNKPLTKAIYETL